MKNHLNAGYSLVEIAIVLVIMGLILGGILKGRDLIESARIKSVLTQINEYRIATHTFMDMFHALPGNYAHAREHINSELKNGDGQGVLTGDGLARNSQAGQFWAHLGQAGLITQPGLPDETNLHFNKGAPSTRLGGGITVIYEDGQHWFLLGTENGTQGNGPLLTPKQAMSIDTKMDNGLPTMGRIRARDGAGVSAHSCVTSDGQYNTLLDERVCILYFQF